MKLEKKSAVDTAALEDEGFSGSKVFDFKKMGCRRC